MATLDKDDSLNKTKRSVGEHLLAIVMGLLGLLIGGMAGILLAFIVFVIGLAIIVALYAIGILFPLPIVGNTIEFLQNIADFAIYAVFIGTALIGAVIGYISGGLPAWLRRNKDEKGGTNETV